MNWEVYRILANWTKAYITDADLAQIIGGSDATRYGIVNRAIKEGILIHIRRGLFVISIPGRERQTDLFELAQMIYGPSFISFESALRYHNIIPEGVYITSSVTCKRSREFSTPMGIFSYKRIPKDFFLLGVERIEQNSISFFMAHPWRAFADLIYINRKDWVSLEAMYEEMRVDDEFRAKNDSSLLAKISENYPNKRTRHILKKLLRQ